MSETIIDLIRKHRLTHLNKSITASEQNEQQLHNKTIIVKEQLNTLNGMSNDIECLNLLAYHYYHMKANYYGKSVQTKVKQSKKRDEFWGRVRDCCIRANVSPEHYIKAQFEYFHIILN